jgi:hypothetical protein
MARARCRLGKVFQARKPLVLTTLREAGATNAELESAGKAVDGVAAAMCTNALTKKQKVSLKTQQKALGKIFAQVNERLTAGTALEGHNVTLEAFEDLMREMAQRCPVSSPVTFGGLASLSDSEFDARLDDLAYGSCERSSSIGVGGIPILPAGTDADGYAQCVREAFRQGVTSNTDCQDIARGDGDDSDGDEGGEGGEGGNEGGGNEGEGDEAGEGTEGSGGEAGEGNPAADDHDFASYAIGAGVVAAGVVFVVGGAATSEVGVGVPFMIAGFAMIVGGLEHMDEQSARYIDRNGRQAPWSLWQCPTLSTPVGSFAFAAPTRGGTSGAQPNMTVMDTLRACRCENNPLDDFLASGGTGAFGGPSCDLGSRLDCLRERDNDMGPPSPECRMLLRGDNQVSIAARLQECSVINCGEGLVGEDCSCWSGGGGGSGGGSNPCATVQCPDGAQPIPEGMRCTCESNPLDGPSVDCLPGAPGCDDNTIPGVLPGGGPIPTPLPTPIPMPKPIPNSPFKK